VCLQARDSGVELPRRAVLVYAALHAEIPEPSPELADKLVRLEGDRRITADIARSIALAYVGDEALLRHPYAFPGEGVLDGFPPTLILNSDLDSLRASGEAFGAQLVTAGVDTTVLRMVGAEHAFLNDPDLPAFELGIERIAHWLESCPIAGVVHERLPR
jgi:acetyl esterase/lipase